MRTFIRTIGGFFAMALACTLMTSLGGCNPVKGAGTDIQNVRQAGQNAIDNADKK